ncbi:DUF4350 domain-containing protein [Niastella caeni]|uniref:DUF4350 domain-containing protein n=1 Tax=Niastella caeni TaxID=2569763 RepID=A0A4V6T3S1_9BACT|nr:DUF4350 domain-containing protein [Niastella caeni]THU38076.1 DUF4350 domain-containing protein [Niastella caeni]
MKPIIRYHLLLWLVAIAGLVASCGSGKRMNKRVTLWRSDKIPYGTYYAYENLNEIFPDASVVINKKSPDEYKGFSLKNFKDATEEIKYDDQKTSYIIIADEVIPDENEVAALLSMVARGQHIFISSFQIGETLLDSLHLKTAFYTGSYNTFDSLTVSVNNPETNDSLSYSYPGTAMDNFFVSVDSSITTILGEDKYGQPNFVRFAYNGGGSLFIHLAPITFSNFFLLHKQNKAYYDNVLSYLPQSSEVVRWDDYFRHHKSGRGEGGDSGGRKGLFDASSWMGKQPALARAMWLLLILMLIIYLFESKRKQRIIPVIQPLKNASVDFVKTIGRLYFQRRDNKNLAQKMTVHFQDHVRSTYSIRASLNDPEFEKRLAWKTGYDLKALKDLLYFINMLQDAPDVTDEALLELNHKLEHFYKHA